MLGARVLFLLVAPTALIVSACALESVEAAESRPSTRNLRSNQQFDNPDKKPEWFKTLALDLQR